MVRVTVGSVIALVAFACAGRSVSGDGSNGDGTDGSAGETGGLGGTMTVGGRGGTTSTGGFGGTVGMGAAPAMGGKASGGRGGTFSGGRGGSAGTAGVVDTICALPPDPGPCEGYARAYAFDTETGLCLPFIYGGCEGNANNFETAEDCYRACDRAGIEGKAYCDASVECGRINTECCACTGFAFDTVVGVNREHASVISDTKCTGIECDECVVDSTYAWFGASCRENYCVAWDAR